MRYILAGFIEYGDGSHETFMDNYIPEYDGYAALAGFRTGDMIVGLEVCQEVQEGQEGDDVSVKCETDSSGTKTCTSGSGSSYYIRETAQGGRRVRRHMESITGDLVEDSDWVAQAQSCEILDTGADTVIRVRRRVT